MQGRVCRRVGGYLKGALGSWGFSKSFFLLVDVERYFLKNGILMLMQYSGGAVPALYGWSAC